MSNKDIPRFTFLRHLDVPQKYRVSHKIVEMLIKSDEIDEETTDKVTHDHLDQSQSMLEEVIKKLTAKEAAFQIAQMEYENKQKRFLKLTNLGEASLDQKYTEQNLSLRDIDEEKIMDAIQTGSVTRIIDELEEVSVIIARDIEIFYDRLSYLNTLWKDISAELLEKIRNFEHLGLKVVSSNLRVKLLPELEVFKQELKEPELTEDAISRSEINQKIDEMVEEAREDIYGDLTQAQAQLLNDINPNLDTEELIEILSNEQMLKDLIVLLETDKIDIRMKKVIDRLI